MKLRSILCGLLMMLALSLSAAVSAADIASSQWLPASGTWTVQDGTITSQSPENSNTNAYIELAQQGNVLTYEWTIKFGETKVSFGPAAGMHFLATDPTNAYRGISYCVFQDKTFIRLYRTTGSALGKVKDFATDAVAVGETHSYKVVFDTRSGVMDVYRDGKLMGSYTDASPLTGHYVSLRAGGTVAEFSQVRVSSSN